MTQRKKPPTPNYFSVSVYRFIDNEPPDVSHCFPQWTDKLFIPMSRFLDLGRKLLPTIISPSTVDVVRSFRPPLFVEEFWGAFIERMP